MKQKGFVLYTALVMLVVISLLAIYMFKSFIGDQKISGNLREKERAIQAATTSLDRAEFWLGQAGNSFTGDFVSGVACNSTNQSGTALVICSNALANPATLPWASSNIFYPCSPASSSSPSCVSTTGGANTYAAGTNVYIQYVGEVASGPTTTAPTATYQVTVSAQGGNATAVTVIQSVFQVQAASVDVSGG